MTPANATLQEVDGRPALRFERALPHPPDRVWRSLTDPGEQAAWHPSPATIEPRVGGRVEFVAGGRFEFPDGVVTDYDPPRLLGYTWGEEGLRADHLLWELRPHDDGCLLVLVHTFEDRPRAASYGAGWHICLDNLAATLAGGDSSGVPAPGEPRWNELNGEYQRRFGISPAATPPPPRD